MEFRCNGTLILYVHDDDDAQRLAESPSSDDLIDID